MLEALRGLGAECVAVDDVKGIGGGGGGGGGGGASGQLVNGMAWRFRVASDPSVARYLVRDVDSRLSRRELAAVRALAASGAPFHAMRDHPAHSDHARKGSPVGGGMWGGTRAACPEMDALLLKAEGARAAHYHADQEFLSASVWPLARARGLLVHDSFSCLEGLDAHGPPGLHESAVPTQAASAAAGGRGGAPEPPAFVVVNRPFPVRGRVHPGDFVGAVVLGDGSTRPADEEALAYHAALHLPCKDHPTSKEHAEEDRRLFSGTS